VPQSAAQTRRADYLTLTPDPNTPRADPLQVKRDGILWRGYTDARGLRGILTLPNELSTTEIRVDFSHYGESATRGRAHVWRAGNEALVLGGFELGTGSFAAPEGNDEAVWDGAPAFDPRMVFAEFAGTRTSFRVRLKETFDNAPYGFFLATDPTLALGRARVDAVSNALLLTVSAAEAYGTRIRIALAATVVKQLLLQAHARSRKALGMAANDGEVAGVVRGYARDVLRQFGTLDTAEIAADVSELLLANARKHHERTCNASVPAQALERALAADVGMFVRYLEQKTSVSAAYEAAHEAAAKEGLAATALRALVPARDLSASGWTKLTSIVHPCFQFVIQNDVDDDATFGFNVEASRTSGKIACADSRGALGRAGFKDDEVVTFGQPYSEGSMRHVDFSIRGSEDSVRTGTLHATAVTMKVLKVKARASVDPRLCRNP
jgi:hypothetical protein